MVSLLFILLVSSLALTHSIYVLFAAIQDTRTRRVEHSLMIGIAVSSFLLFILLVTTFHDLFLYTALWQLPLWLWLNLVIVFLVVFKWIGLADVYVMAPLTLVLVLFQDSLVKFLLFCLVWFIPFILYTTIVKRDDGVTYPLVTIISLSYFSTLAVSLFSLL